jgi:hypothetical protein
LPIRRAASAPLKARPRSSMARPLSNNAMSVSQAPVTAVRANARNCAE